LESLPSSRGHGRAGARLGAPRRNRGARRRLHRHQLPALRGHAARAGSPHRGGVVRRRPIVAIDGPAGAGKTTVSQQVAEALGYVRLDTGALYRVVALAAARQGVDWSDQAGVTRLAEELDRRGAIRFETAEAGKQRVMLDAEDVSVQIRDQAMGQGASRVSAIPGVRAALLAMQ